MFPTSIAITPQPWNWHCPPTSMFCVKNPWHLPKQKRFASSNLQRIGKLLTLRAGFSFLLYDLIDRPARATSGGGGGAIRDLGCYLLDFVTSITGTQDPVREWKIIHRYDPSDPGFVLESHALLQFESGITANLSVAVDSPSLNVWEVTGTHGAAATLRFDTQGLSPVPLYQINEESEGNLSEIAAENTFKLEFEHFLDGVRGAVLPHISPAESIQNAEWLERWELG